MDETTLKTVENAVVICAESAKNATESATKALDANMKVETLVGGIDDKVRTAVDSATAAREAAEQVTAIKGEVEGLKNNAVSEATKAANAAATAVTASTSVSLTVTQVTTLAKRAEDAAQTAQNGAAFCEEMQDEIGATKTKIDATAKVVQSNADAVAGAKKEIDTAIATANTEIDGKVGVATQAVTDANQSKADAETAKKGAEEARDKAQQSADSAVVDATNVMRYAFVDVSVVDGVAQLADRAINQVSADGAVTFAMPPSVDGKVRDFLVDFVGESVDFEGVTILPRDGDDSHLVPEEGTNIFAFTEIKPNTFLASRTKVVEA